MNRVNIYLVAASLAALSTSAVAQVSPSSDTRGSVIELLFLGLSGRFSDPMGPEQYIDNEYYGVNAELVWQSPIGTLTVMPAYRVGKLDYIFHTTGFPIRFQDDQKLSSLEAVRGTVGVHIYPFGGFVRTAEWAEAATAACAD